MTPPSPHSDHLSAFEDAVSAELNAKFPARTWTAQTHCGTPPVLRVLSPPFKRDYDLDEFTLREGPDVLAMLIWVDIMEGM